MLWSFFGKWTLFLPSVLECSAEVILAFKHPFRIKYIYGFEYGMVENAWNEHKYRTIFVLVKKAKHSSESGFQGKKDVEPIDHVGFY